MSMRGAAPERVANAGIQSAAPERVANAGANEKPMRGEAPERVATVEAEPPSVLLTPGK
jgi:hypothetical protein